MKILFCSHVFAPSVGGTETVGRLLAEEFAAAGHETRVVTQTPGASTQSFAVYRQPSGLELWRLFRWTDVVFHNNISLRFAWMLAAVRRPWVVAHHTWLDGSSAAAKFKRAVLGLAGNVAISKAVANALPVPSRVIPDPYDAQTFFVRREIPRDRDFIFVGRMVSDKGGHDLLDAAEMLWAGGWQFTLTLVGDGPERARLEERAAGRAAFAGMLPPEQLAEMLNRHRVAVFPSRWNEPFGVVALEAIACGCAVIGSSGGGLPEAIGRCGRLFANGNTAELAGAMAEMLSGDLSIFTHHSEAHLNRHQPSVVARQYLEIFESVPCKSG